MLRAKQLKIEDIKLDTVPNAFYNLVKIRNNISKSIAVLSRELN